MNEILKKLFNIFVWIVVAFTVLVMIFTIVSVNTFNRNDRDVFGYKAYIVRSDSMSATDFSAGDLVIVKEVDPTTLREGDIISFISQDPQYFGQTVTHKIRTAVYSEKGENGFITYGTTTGVEDTAMVTYPYILGKYQFSLPKVGYFFDSLKSPMGYVLFILLPCLLLIGYQGLNCIKLFRRYKQEQLAMIEAEKEALAEERRRSGEMMEELARLKAQLAEGEPIVAQTAEPEEAHQENIQLDDILAEFTQPEKGDV